jgi:hypothetical protein
LVGLGEKTASPDKEQDGDEENDQILAVHGFFSFWHNDCSISDRILIVWFEDVADQFHGFPFLHPEEG